VVVGYRLAVGIGYDGLVGVIGEARLVAGGVCGRGDLVTAVCRRPIVPPPVGQGRDVVARIGELDVVAAPPDARPRDLGQIAARVRNRPYSTLRVRYRGDSVVPVISQGDRPAGGIDDGSEVVARIVVQSDRIAIEVYDRRAVPAVAV